MVEPVKPGTNRTVGVVCCDKGVTNRWGPWRLSNDGRALERHWDDPIRHRPLDLHRCTTAAEVLDTIFHEARSGLADTDDAVLAGLVRALDDLLNPMANLCSGGKARTMSKQQLLDILGRGGTR